MIERRFDIPLIADLALREKQIQQNYRPIIAVHKWFARRPGTLFRGLLLSEFVDGPLARTFYQPNRLDGVRVADPFMGGGTPLLEANRMGCDVIGFDINPMSYWIVKEEIEHIDLDQYVRSAQSLRAQLEQDIGQLYRTRCCLCGTEDAHVKYFLWVKVARCRGCGKSVDLFPGYLVAADSRHPKNVFVCRACGQLTETADRREPGPCRHCGAALCLQGPARGNLCECSNCGATNAYPNAAAGEGHCRPVPYDVFPPRNPSGEQRSLLAPQSPRSTSATSVFAARRAGLQLAPTLTTPRIGALVEKG